VADALHAQLARVVREHAGRLAASLMHVTGDFATAEDLVQDAVLAALRHWPSEGIPQRPDAWLFTVARRRGLEAQRREDNYRTKLAQLQWPVQPEPDDRLRLIFTCCHPALSRDAQIALTLRVVCGLTTAQIARAFLVHETTMAQRITRAKRKITDAGIPYRIPADDELGARLTEVLAVIYLLLNEGYLSTAERAQSRDLVDDAEWLASLLHELMPTEPEVAGLLALIRLHRARAVPRHATAPGHRAALHVGATGGDDRTGHPRRRAGPLSPVPRHPRRSRARTRPPRPGPGRRLPRPRADRQPRRTSRTPAAHRLDLEPLPERRVRQPCLT
jgi:RNA polymerase sigma factor (sigma-70 family)